MPGVVRSEIEEEGIVIEPNENGNSTPFKENSIEDEPLNSPKSHQADGNGYAVDEVVDTSIEHLYDNVCEMQSSDQSPSRRSFGSDGEESRIDSELRHLVGGEMREVEIMEEEVGMQGVEDDDFRSDSGSKKGSSSAGKKSKKSRAKSVSSSNSKKASNLNLESDSTSSPKSRSPPEKPPLDKQNHKVIAKPSGGSSSAKKQKNISLRGVTSQNGATDSSDSGLENPDLGPFLLKQARDLISSGDNPQKALQFALRAAKSFEKCSNGKPTLDVVMCLHVTAAIYCTLGQYSEAIPILEHSIEIPVIEEGQEHALAKFAGHMQLGDTYAMVGQFESSIMCYTMGLEVQRQVMGDTDPRVGETCRYLAEAHVQALQFDEAEKLCQMAIDIHRDNASPASIEEAADRRLMGLICETKGDHEAALEHLVLASMAMVANGQEKEVASVDISIGDTYLSLSRYDEAVFAYQKALTAFKSTKGENHPTVASVFVRLADLYNKTGKLKDSKSYCENALRIYEKPLQGTPPEEIASGLTDVSAIYESMNELDQALKLLKKALKIYNDAPGQQNTIVGIESQMGVIYYMLGNYSESYTSFKNTITKLTKVFHLTSDMEYLVLASDGLWEQVGNQEVVDILLRKCSVERELGSSVDTVKVNDNRYDCISSSASPKLRRLSLIKKNKLLGNSSIHRKRVSCSRINDDFGCENESLASKARRISLVNCIKMKPQMPSQEHIINQWNDIANDFGCENESPPSKAQRISLANQMKTRPQMSSQEISINQLKENANIIGSDNCSPSNTLKPLVAHHMNVKLRTQSRENCIYQLKENVNDFAGEDEIPPSKGQEISPVNQMKINTSLSCVLSWIILSLSCLLNSCAKSL